MLLRHVKRIYQKLKWSQWAELYRSVRFPEYRRAIKKEIDFLEKIVPPDSVIFDIGANLGSKTYIFLKLRAKKVIVVEPDFDCCRILNYRFGKNRRVKIVNKAVDCQKGVKTFYVLDSASGYNTLSKKWVQTLADQDKSRFKDTMTVKSYREITTTTLDELICEWGEPKIIKIDIEGSELQAINGLSHQVNVVWFEANLPEFKEETIDCIRSLFRISPDFKFNYTINAYRWEFNRWVDASSMIQEIRKGKSRFMEIFASL